MNALYIILDLITNLALWTIGRIILIYYIANPVI